MGCPSVNCRSASTPFLQTESGARHWNWPTPVESRYMTPCTSNSHFDCGFRSRHWTVHLQPQFGTRMSKRPGQSRVSSFDTCRSSTGLRCHCQRPTADPHAIWPPRNLNCPVSSSHFWMVRLGRRHFVSRLRLACNAVSSEIGEPGDLPRRLVQRLGCLDWREFRSALGQPAGPTHFDRRNCFRGSDPEMDGPVARRGIADIDVVAGRGRGHTFTDMSSDAL